MKREIIAKFKKGDFSSLSTEEITFISENTDFIFSLLDRFGKNEKIWEEYPKIIIHALKRLYRAAWHSNISETLFHLKYEKFFLYAVRYLPVEYLLEECVYNIFLDKYNVYTSKNSRSILNIILDRLKPIPDNENVYTQEIIKLFLENGKYADIKYITKVKDLTLELAMLLIENYPFEEIGIPLFLSKIINGDFTSCTYYGSRLVSSRINAKIDGMGLYKIINRIGLNNIQLDKLIGLLNMENWHHAEKISMLFADLVFKKTLENPAEINDILNERCYLDLRSATYSISLYFRKYNKVGLKQLIDAQIYIFGNEAIECGLITMQKIMDNVIANFDREEVLSSFICMLELYGTYVNVSNESSGKLINILLENGKLNILTKYILPKDNYISSINDIYSRFEKLFFNSDIYDEDIKSLDDSIVNYPYFLKLILQTNKLSNFTFLKTATISSIRSNYLEDILYNYMMNYEGDLIIDPLTRIPFIADILIKNGDIEKLTSWIIIFGSSVLNEISTYAKEQILDIIKSDSSVLNNILKSRIGYKFIILSEEIFNYCLSSNILDKNSLLDYANHHEEYTTFYTKETCMYFKDYILERYNVKEENYLYFAMNISPYVLKYIDNPNIIVLLNMDINDLMKVGKLFATEDYSIRDIETLIDSIEQHWFTLNKPNIVNSFSNIIQAFEGNNGDFSAKSYYINDIPKYLSDSFLEELFVKYPILRGKDSKKDILIYILKGIINSDNPTLYRNILHEITDFYIQKNRERYRTFYGVELIDIPFEYEESSIKKILMSCILERDWMIGIDGEIRIFSDWLDDYLVLYNFPKGTSKYFLRQRNDTEKRYKFYDDDTYKRINTLAIKFLLSNNKIFNDAKLRKGVIQHYNSNIRRKYKIENNTEFMCQILSQVSIQLFKSNVLDNDEVYNAVAQMLKKYKFHIMPHYVIKYLAQKHDHQFGIEEIATLIVYYNRILEQENISNFGRRCLPIYKLVEAAIILSTNLNYYVPVLGKENTLLIKSNPIPNPATKKLSNNERLKEAVEWTIKNYNRNCVTVPTFNEVFSLNNKSMRIIVGNFTHPSNITHGERTGACMRIGGVGESLFNFVLENQNGFHIRFESAETGEYISRVSGFRNGNTVFLNELRCSLNLNEYSNSDVVDFCKSAAKKIIEISKNSSYPIENVVIHNDYATRHCNLKSIDLGVANIKEGLPRFYSDVSRYAIVLATSAVDDNFVPLKLGFKDLPIYSPAREKVLFSDNYNDIREYIDRVEAIKILLENNTAYYEINSLSLEDTFAFGYANMDWYTYLDINGNIHTEILGLDKRAHDELDIALENIKSKTKKFNSKN